MATDQPDNRHPYNPGPDNWTKATEETPCPICGKPDWCLLSSENPEDPKAVICGRVAEGATQPLGEAGYLHVRKAEGQVCPAGRTLLQLSELPTLVVEGQSDVCAGLDLGFITVGKPSAVGGFRYLSDLLTSRDVIILGENDSGAGRVGMKKTFEALKGVVKSAVKVMPPEGIKDLRAWKQAGLTQAELLEAAKAGDSTSDSNILDDRSPLAVAELWLQREQSQDGTPILRKYQGVWYHYNGHHYAEVDEDTIIRGGLYAFLKDKQYRQATAKGVEVKPFEPDRCKVTNIIDALNMSCPIDMTPPCWLDGEASRPPTRNLVVFANGMLDLEAGQAAELLPPTHTLFTLASLPYAFDPDAQCPVWLKFLAEIFPDDPAKSLLLQEWFGYNMIPDTSQEKMMMFVGRPGGGKGTVLETMRAVLGEHQVASTSFDGLTSEFGLAPLLGKLAVILPDAHTSKRGDLQKALEVIKSISGRDALSINRKFLDHKQSHRLLCRITMAVNDLPDLPDHARTLERRLLLIYFGQTFEGREDRTLKDRLTQEVQGVAAWGLEGLRRLRVQGQFTQPKSSIPVLGEFRRLTSPLTEFLEETCERGDRNKCWVLKSMIYDAWNSWSKQHGVPQWRRAQFGQRLLALNPGIMTGRRMQQAYQEYVYEGLRLTEDAIRKYVVR